MIVVIFGMGGGEFPLADNSFDVVVSLDTLEHVPVSNRRDFVGECLRIARHGVIIAAPYGSQAHRSCEADLCEYLEQAHRPNRWLAEHVENGLPTPDDVLGYKKLFEDRHYFTSVYYAGDYLWQSRNLKLAVQLTKMGLPDRFANLLAFALGLRIWRPVRFFTSPVPLTNRFYLFGTKVPGDGE